MRGSRPAHRPSLARPPGLNLSTASIVFLRQIYQTASGNLTSAKRLWPLSTISEWEYGVLVSMDATPIKVSFTFYPADVQALNRCVVGLRRAGLPVRGGTVLRALIHLTSATEMFAHAVLLAKTYERKGGPREADYVAGHPTVDLPPDLVKKLDDVVTELAEKLIPANRAFVVRALLRTAPDAKTLAPAIKKYLATFPPRPRGWAAHKARPSRKP